MTALCGGGTSSANPTAAGVVSVTLDFLSIATSTYEIEWLSQALGAISPFPSYVLPTFCAMDPPAMPSWTLAESTALQSLDLLSPDFVSGAAKVPDWIANVVWNSYCQCTSGTYTPAANPATPSGTPIPTAPLGLATSAPCKQSVFNINNNFTGNFAALSNGETYSTLFAVPNGGTSVQWITNYAEFSGATRTSYTAELTFYASDHVTILGTSAVQFISASGSYVSGYTNYWESGVAAGQPAPASYLTLTSLQFEQAICGLGQTATLPQGTAFIGCTYHSTASSPDTVEVLMAIYCGTTPGASAQSSCCPTDPAVLSILNATLKAVTLLQRQVAPFAYVLGTSHSVSGTGSFAIQGLLGVQVTLTAIGNEVGEQVGTPDSLFGAGWINWGTADGFTAREYIANSPFLSMPAEAGQYTVLGYSLPSTAPAVIVEISREP